MDIFAQNKLLMRLTIVLAILNIASIGVFVWKDFGHHPPQNPPQRKGRPPRPEDFKNGQAPPQSEDIQDVAAILEEELHLTKTQVTQIQALRADFFKKEEILKATIRAKKDSMNEAMFNKITDEAFVKSLARSIADSEYLMELLRLEQAKTLKTICTPEQLEKFEQLVLEIRDYFRPINQSPEKK
jgi:hypothetical protein